MDSHHLYKNLLLHIALKLECRFSVTLFVKVVTFGTLFMTWKHAMQLFLYHFQELPLLNKLFNS
jgi:hypothetical protein